MNFHTVAGLPRSGSTLLCNLLNQRPDTRVSSTSALPTVLRNVSEVLTNSPEVTSDLATDPDAAERSVRVLRGIIDSWHATRTEDIVIDKSRGWAQAALLLQRVVPDAAMIVTIRDPREVFASVERQHRRTAEYASTDTIFARADTMMSPEGLIGGPIQHVEDLVRRRLPRVLFLAYTALAADPVGSMRRVDAAFGLDEFGYDTVNVESTATDLDVLYRNKFPHDGSGPVEERQAGWGDVMNDELAGLIAGRWPFFMQTFGFS